MKQANAGSLRPKQFASDNYAPVCPEAWESFAEANSTHTRSYGDDPWTERACNLMRDLFEKDCEVFFVFNGTAANSLALASLCQSYHGIVCHEVSHVQTDECGAPEFFSNGTKLLQGAGENGKLSAPSVEEIVTKRTDIHFPCPKVISVTQATELGTVYTTEHLKDLEEVATRHKLKIHMDGARFANAVASLKVSPADVTWRAGVDVLCFGGAKNGLPLGEAVIFFNRELAAEFDYRCKQAGQLSSKMRFLSAPWIGLLESGAWLKNAQTANRAAQTLRMGFENLGLKPLFPVEANAVFVDIPKETADRLKDKGWIFYSFIGGANRFMCSWDTTQIDIDELLQDLSRSL